MNTELTQEQAIEAIKGFLENFMTTEEKIAQAQAKAEMFKKEAANFELAVEMLKLGDM